ncbi:DUF3251 domain-containing protein [Marilutibacter spongiae]|uniref:DUF3251 domain-containing protein n=1 Tax=Marilutibacter spongiae TaxID=2025720 RepID=A0A7W3Y6U5_9GAMM|nr:DUF3251 domain-containing protein [Lysobacter spongiae]MBB1061858.1 DUF3251 domain-containing protein [Lysobacter spongiae]
MSARLKNVEDRNLEQLARIVELESRVDRQGQSSAPSPVAEIDPAGESGFHVLDTGISPVLVSLDSTSQRADGSLVKLRVGNISAGDITGGTIRVLYGPRFDAQGAQDYSAWRAALRSKEQSIVMPLRSGSWTLVDLPLNSPPDRLGYLQVQIQSSRVSLNQTQ